MSGRITDNIIKITTLKYGYIMRDAIIIISKYTLAVFTFLAIMMNLAAAGGKAGNLEINSNPKGVEVVLSGEVEVSAVAPCRIVQNLTGDFKVTAFKPGYEDWKSEFFIPPGGNYSLNIKLSRKTKFKAAFRSILMPGWGQFYSGRKFEGVMLGLASLSSAGATLIINKYYNDKYDEYRSARTDYNCASSADEAELLYKVYSDKHRDVYNAETLLRTAAGVTIGLWVYNILDSILFFPDYRAGTIAGFEPSIQSAVIDGNPGIILTAKF